MATREQFIGDVLAGLFYAHMVSSPSTRVVGTREDFNRLLFAMISNRMTRWEDAMALPERLCERMGSDDVLECLTSHSVDEIAGVIAQPRALHRYPMRIATSLCVSARMVRDEWDGSVATMWGDEPLVETLVARLKSLHGVGDKIANLTARVLLLEFSNVSVWSGISGLRPSPDRHVLRVFHRLGLIASEHDVKGLFEAAERIRPCASLECDGAWEVGLSWCHASQPECGVCRLSRACAKRH